MNKNTLLHLICGPIGAGKTTYANGLANELAGTVFSIDNWMATLFQADLPKDFQFSTMDPGWFSDRVDRCESLIYAMSSQILKTGGIAILDMGYIRKSRRDLARSRALDMGFDFKLHYITADLPVRKLRVEQRNQQSPDSGKLFITPEMFSFADRYFEEPDDQELAFAEIVKT